MLDVTLGQPGDASDATCAPTARVTRSVLQAIEDRGGMVASGLSQGRDRVHDGLEELLIKEGGVR